MNVIEEQELNVLSKLSSIDLTQQDKLNIYGEVDVPEQVGGADAEVGVFLKAWVSLKKELYLAICTDDPKYKVVRDSAVALESEVSTVAVTLVSALTIGIPTAILISVAKVLIVTVARLGINVFCKVNESDKVVGRLTQREQQILVMLYKENANP